MFNRDFYPTPKPVIERMLSGIDIYNNVILEPSAGKGDIVDYLNEAGAKEVLSCEINKDLAKIAASKSQLIASDFLTISTEQISHVNVIVMNPPFSADETHILHAWSIAPGGCTIISLCNDNTVHERVCLSKKRQELRNIIDLHGRSECFGECFSTAERKTDVNVACVWLNKPRTGDDEFSDYFSLEEDEITRNESGIMSYNYVRDIVNRYVSAIRLFDKIEPLSKQINDLTAPISKYGIKFGAYKASETNHSSDSITREIYKKDLQKRALKRIFEDMKMEKYVTEGVKATINKFVETQVNVPFTMKNIYKMIDIIVGTHSSRMDSVIVDAFETICSFAWRENCTGGESWKTNSEYVVNKRFIIPYMCQYDTWRYGSSFVSLSHYGGNKEKIEDVVKALCNLTGTNYDTCTTLYNFVFDNSLDWGQWWSWGFFNIRGYKKGTMHFEFKDEKVWKMFNRRVAQIKGWALPQTSNATKKDRRKSTGLSTI